MNVLKSQWFTLSDMLINDVTPNTPQWTLIKWQLNRIEDEVGRDVAMTWLDEEADDLPSLEQLFSKADDIMSHPVYS